jgi:hypothetical protein
VDLLPVCVASKCVRRTLMFPQPFDTAFFRGRIGQRCELPSEYIVE